MINWLDDLVSEGEKCYYLLPIHDFHTFLKPVSQFICNPSGYEQLFTSIYMYLVLFKDFPLITINKSSFNRVYPSVLINNIWQNSLLNHPFCFNTGLYFLFLMNVFRCIFRFCNHTTRWSVSMKVRTHRTPPMKWWV